MTRIIVTGASRIAVQAITMALHDAATVVVGTGTVTMKVNDPDLPAFNFPEPAHFAQPRNSGRRVAQWKTERKGWRS